MREENRQSERPVALSDLAMFVASEGDERQEPLVLIERALALAPEDTYVQFNAAETYEALGYRKDALDWVAKLVAAGYPIDDINDSPVLADLVKDSRYQTIVKDQAKHPAKDRMTAGEQVATLRLELLLGPSA